MSSENESSRHIAIIGSGPTGIEAALAAAERGLSFTLYEAGPAPASSVSAWGHVRLFTPWSLNLSPRMRNALRESAHQIPPDDDFPTGHELVERGLIPEMNATLRDRLALESRIRHIGRDGLLKNEEIGSERRSQTPFRLVVENGAGTERVETADVVLDCSGTWGNPNALGTGGVPAPGESAAGNGIVREIPDVVTDEGTWAGRTTLLVGAGHSAQTAAVALAGLAERHPGTRVLWAFRGEPAAWSPDPDDPLPGRAQLLRDAARLVQDPDSAVEPIDHVAVDSLDRSGERWQVTLRRTDGSTRTVEADRVLALTGFVPDASIYRQLQVHECYATSGPMKLAAALLGSGNDCLAQETHGAETLLNPEPNFFILGAKSYGRNNTFLMRVGWEQVDEVFSLIDPPS